MKNGVKFFIIVISIILLFSIVLGVCIGCISSYEGERSYDTDESFMSVIGGIASQADMQKKFGVYNHVETDSENTILHIFSEEQADNIISQRKDGKKFYLTYDEALFLINDSTRLYFEYDTVVLNGAYDTGVLSPESSLSAKTINCYHGDFSEFNYDSAVQAYNQMLNDINNIIRHRIAMLDSRIIPVVLRIHAYSGMPGYGFSVSLEGDYGFEEKNDALEWCRSEQYVIVFDDGKSTEDEYKALVKSTLEEKYLSPNYSSFSDISFPITDTSEDKTDEQVYKYPFIQMFSGYYFGNYYNLLNSDCSIYYPVGEPFQTLCIVATNSYGKSDSVFPSERISDMCPQWYLTPEYFNTDSITVNMVYCDRGNNVKQKWELTTITDKSIINDIISALGDLQAISDKVNTEKENIVPTQDNPQQFFYELDLNNGTSIEVPANTGYKTAANVYKSTSKTSGFPMLYDSFPAEFIDTVRDICKPYADEYMELDENGNYVYSVKTKVTEKYYEILQYKKTRFDSEYRLLLEKIPLSMPQEDYDTLPEYSDFVYLLNVDKDYCWIALKYCYDTDNKAEQEFLIHTVAMSVGAKNMNLSERDFDEGMLMLYYILTQACK